MNILEVQDALKDFSQDQLVKEMQMPSGQAPQFLVLSELNRRQRMKQTFEAQEAQGQPTVAEKLVAAAGAPQGGIGAMAQSMAPQTDMAMNTGIAQMQEPMSGEVMGMQGGGYIVGGTSIGSGGGLYEPQLEATARKFNMTVPQLKQLLAQQGLPLQRRASANTTAQPAVGAAAQSGLAPQQASASGSILSAFNPIGSAQAQTVTPTTNEPIEEDDEGSFLDSVGGFLEDRYFEDDGDFDLSQAIFDAGGIATLAVPGGAVARGLYAGAKALPRLLSGQGVQTAAGKAGRFLQKGFTRERKTDRPVPTTGSAPRTQEFVDRVFSPKRAAQVGGPLVMGGALTQEFIEGMGQGVPPAGSDDKNTGAGAGAGAGAGQATTQDRIMDLLEKRQKSADMDKYLALAQAGFTLMQPAEGGFSDALGKAGIAGVQAYQEAEDRYQTGLADILDTEIALAKLGETTTEKADTYSQIIDRLSKAVELGIPGAQEAMKGYLDQIQESNKAGIAV